MAICNELARLPWLIRRWSIAKKEKRHLYFLINFKHTFDDKCLEKLWKIIISISLSEIFWFLHFSFKLSLYFHILGVSTLAHFLFWKTCSHVLWCGKVHFSTKIRLKDDTETSPFSHVVRSNFSRKNRQPTTSPIAQVVRSQTSREIGSKWQHRYQLLTLVVS